MTRYENSIGNVVFHTIAEYLRFCKVIAIATNNMA